MPDPSAPPSALVVDDDAIILTDAEGILEAAGFRTLTAMNAREAIDILKEHAESVTVLFSDVEMPGDMNGFDLARYTAEHWPDIAIIVASGRIKCTDGDLPDGAVFLSKPFSAEVVHGHLHILLAEEEKPEPLKNAVRAQ